MKRLSWFGTITGWRTLAQLALKTVAILIVINFLWALLQPMNVLDHISIYNSLVAGRLRFGYGELANPNAISLSRLNEMFTDHEISAPYTDREYRIGIFGGSGTWGFGLNPNQTLAADINQQHFILPDGRLIRAFNLAYPVPSITRDVLLAEHAFTFHLDAAYWFVNPIGFFRKRYVNPSKILTDNPSDMLSILAKYGIRLPAVELPISPPLIWEQTLIGQREFVNSWVQEQLYGFYWQQTRYDFNVFSPDLRFHGGIGDGSNTFVLDGVNYNESQVNTADFVFEAMDAAIQIASDAHVQLTFIIDPMWIATTAQSKDYYNEYFPRWFYDIFSRNIKSKIPQTGWRLLDWHDILPQDSFTDSVFHYTPQAARTLSDSLLTIIQTNNSSQ